MVKFRSAIIFFIIFIILGAVINAENPSKIYGDLVLDYPELKKNISNYITGCSRHNNFIEN